MAQRPPPIVIGIAGGTGSGKTTVASVILDRVGAERITFLPQDAYYRDLADLPLPQRATVNFDHPESLETDLLIAHLQQLKRWQPVEVPVYDFTTHERTDRTTRVEPHPVILVEGILVFAEPQLRELFDVKLFVDTPADVRFIRRLQRDIREHRAPDARGIRGDLEAICRRDHSGGRVQRRGDGHGRRPSHRTSRQTIDRRVLN